MPPIQELIHKLEEGAGKGLVQGFTLALALLTLLVAYDLREYKNFYNPDSMDAAQLARNIAEGRGYTTQNIRPFAIYLRQRHAKNLSGDMRAELLKGNVSPERRQDLEQKLSVYDSWGSLNTPQPDLYHAPVYPLILAGLMKVLPFKYEIPTAAEAVFQRFQPELLIAFFNQAMMLVATFLIFFLGRKLFDLPVAWVSAGVFIGSDLIWRFSVSGGPTMLMVVMMLGLVWCVVWLEEAVRLGQRTTPWFLLMGAAVGGVLGVGALTRYSFGSLLIPTLVFIGIYLGKRRWAVGGVALAVFLVLLTPWLVRNYQLSGALFGVAGYAVHQETGTFYGNKLENSLAPDLSKSGYTTIKNKLQNGLFSIFQNDLPKLGGSWVSAFFLAGLLLPFRRVALSRLRMFLLMALLTLCVMQALGKTYLSVLAPEVTSENLLVLTVPLVFMFGVGMFFLLLSQMRFSIPELRHVVTAGFIVVASAPLLLTMMPPRAWPVAYPPYYPPLIQKAANWMEPDDLMMSDVSAAVAWYGNRQCMGLISDLQRDFFAVHDYNKPVRALYLTPVTLDSRFMTQLLGQDTRPWGLLLLESLLKKEVPAGFPLKVAAPGFFPLALSDQVFLTDRPRWTREMAR